VIRRDDLLCGISLSNLNSRSVINLNLKLCQAASRHRGHLPPCRPRQLGSLLERSRAAPSQPRRASPLIASLVRSGSETIPLLVISSARSTLRQRNLQTLGSFLIWGTLKVARYGAMMEKEENGAERYEPRRIYPRVPLRPDQPCVIQNLVKYLTLRLCRRSVVDKIVSTMPKASKKKREKNADFIVCFFYRCVAD
jgi:hypothetical protein